MTSWRPMPYSFTAFTAGGGTILASLDAEELAKRPFTIIRTHLFWRIQTDQSIASENQFAGLGMCVVSEEAAAVGVTAVPTPITDLGSDLWFVHELMANQYQFLSGIGAGNVGIHSWIDSKAMRKVNDDQDALLVGEFDTALSDGFTLIVGGRLLIKEH